MSHKKVLKYKLSVKKGISTAFVEKSGHTYSSKKMKRKTKV
jgi:hypothetical protein